MRRTHVRARPRIDEHLPDEVEATLSSPSVSGCCCFVTWMFLCSARSVAIDLHLYDWFAKAESMADGKYGIMAGAVLLNGIASLVYDSERLSCLADPDRSCVAG
jgi:hypothetical protein